MEMREMKDIISLQALRRSNRRKHHAIYDKARRIIAEGLVTPVLSDKEIMEIVEGFPTLRINIVMGGDIVVRSLKDNWMIRDEGRFYTLYHNVRGVPKRLGRTKECYHIQDIFRDLSYIFASIVSHDEYCLGIRKRSAYEVKELIS